MTCCLLMLSASADLLTDESALALSTLLPCGSESFETYALDTNMWDHVSVGACVECWTCSHAAPCAFCVCASIRLAWT